MKRLTLRYVFFVLGVAINSFGVAFITKSALGTSQISSVPYVLSLRFPDMSFGVCTFLFNMLFILGQVVLLKKAFRPIQFLQIAVNVLFSGLIDVSMAALWFFQPESLPVRLFSLVVGCVILAVGIGIEVAPDVLVVPGEGIVRAISQVSGKRFGTVKVYFDVTLIVIAVALSFLFFGKLNGIGVGDGGLRPDGGQIRESGGPVFPADCLHPRPEGADGADRRGTAACGTAGGIACGPGVISGL